MELTANEKEIHRFPVATKSIEKEINCLSCIEIKNKGLKCYLKFDRKQNLLVSTY